MRKSGRPQFFRWLIGSLLGILWLQPVNSTFSRLVMPCETPIGAGRCVADRKCCQDFGGVIFTSEGLVTPKKELIQYRIAGLNAPKDFIPSEREDFDGPGHIFPRSNALGCSDSEVCCFIQPVFDFQNEKVKSSCDMCGLRGDGDNTVSAQPNREVNVNIDIDQESQAPLGGREFPTATIAHSTTKTTTTTTTTTTTSTSTPSTTTTTTTERPLPPRKVIPRIFDYSYSFDFTKMARIIGGSNAKVNANCWQVALSNSSGVFGSGVLLDYQTVLTVAHKVANLKRSDFIAILGAYDFASDELFAQTYYTFPLDIIVHPKYDPITFENDIAILKIPPVSCDKPNICTICLPDAPVDASVCSTRAIPKSLSGSSYRPLKPGESLIFHRDDYLDPNEVSQVKLSSGTAAARNGPVGSVCDRRCVVSGWGSTRDQEIATVLQETKMEVINNRDCEARLKATGVRNYTLPASTFCARADNDDSGTCDRDGGGPLVCQREDGRWELTGLTALGVDQCRFGDQAPSIFVTVGRYIDWILRAGFTRRSSTSSSNSSPAQVNMVTNELKAPVKHLELRSDLEPSPTTKGSPPLAVVATIDTLNGSSGPSPQLKLFSFKAPQAPSLGSASIPVPSKSRNLLELRELRNDDIRAEY
ncbi:hypothetical protein RvY_15620 [Ramazzottius varieornatus]|uniref:Peptidase S1 domain-containing protein n=1 Tax=Ramazzottius varieornatus TaxID=947166 RepID=A0A1D1VVJ7_RAMVA|nr:hypothetical protein RvY_15620 [Ramazzottius varieornatus]